MNKVYNEKYKLYNGDCLEVLKTLKDESVDLIVTDPPYRITSRGNSGTSGGMLNTDLSRRGKIFKHNDLKPKDYIPELYRVLKNNSHCYIMTNHINLYDILTVAKESGFHFTKSLIWNKGNKIMNMYYMSQFEYVLFFRKGKAKKINNCGTSDILDVPNKKTKDINGKNIHDTEKPVELMNILINNSSNVGDVVLDPFLGVGATGIASVQSERKFIGIELDDKYFDIAKQRIENSLKE